MSNGAVLLVMTFLAVLLILGSHTFLVAVFIITSPYLKAVIQPNHLC